MSLLFRYFEKQFELVEHLQLPLFLHSRAAAADFSAIIKRHRDKIKGGVVSCFIEHILPFDKSNIVTVPQIQFDVNILKTDKDIS